jgi:hypothetical protein
LTKKAKNVLANQNSKEVHGDVFCTPRPTCNNHALTGAGSKLGVFGLKGRAVALWLELMQGVGALLPDESPYTAKELDQRAILVNELSYLIVAHFNFTKKTKLPSCSTEPDVPAFNEDEDLIQRDGVDVAENQRPQFASVFSILQWEAKQIGKEWMEDKSVDRFKKLAKGVWNALPNKVSCYFYICLFLSANSIIFHIESTPE